MEFCTKLEIGSKKKSIPPCSNKRLVRNCRPSESPRQIDSSPFPRAFVDGIGISNGINPSQRELSHIFISKYQDTEYHIASRINYTFRLKEILRTLSINNTTRMARLFRENHWTRNDLSKSYRPRGIPAGLAERQKVAETVAKQ